MKYSAQHKHRRIPAWVYKSMLVLAAAIWGMGTVVLKDTVTAFPPLWLVGIRFVSAGVILLAVFWRTVAQHISRDTLVAGVLLGLLVGPAYMFNTTGLTDTTASKSAFLTSTYCVMTPFLAWAFSRIKPTRYNLLAAVLCVGGVALVSLSGTESLALSFGDAITLASAVFLALQLVLQAKFADGRDAMVLTIVQFIVGGLFACVCAACAEGVPQVQALTDPIFLGNLAYLVIFASCLALSLQNVGLAHVPAAPASLFLATESIFGVVFSIMLLGEVITLHMVAGFALIGGAIVVSEAFPLRKTRLDPAVVQAEEERASEGR